MISEKFIKITILITIVGYWYNLAVVTYGVSGTQDLRLFDFTFLILIYYFIFNKKRIDVGHRKFRILSLERFYSFAIWCSLTLILTLLFSFLNGRTLRFLQAILYTYHLWGFFVTVYLSAHFLKKGQFYKNFTTLIISLVFLESILLLLQFAGIVPLLWPDRWIDVYGSDFPSGTLGPNRVVPGLVSFLSLVVSIYFFYQNVGRNRLFKFINNYINVFATLGCTILVGSKTTWITVLLFITFLVIFNFRVVAGTIFKAVGVLILLVVLLPSEITGQLQERFDFVLEDRIMKDQQHIDTEEDATIAEYYDAHGTGRYDLLKEYFRALSSKIWFVVTGAGIVNLSEFVGTSAHNMYLTLVGEVGLIGLVMYCRWLGGYLITRDLRVKNAPRALRNKVEITIPLVLTMMLTLLGGEHLWIYRSTYALLGLFMVVMLLVQYGIFYSYSSQTKQ